MMSQEQIDDELDDVRLGECESRVQRHQDDGQEEQPPVRTHVRPHELEQRVIARAPELFFFALLHR